jgi:ankyrin repeat protein
MVLATLMTMKHLINSRLCRYGVPLLVTVVFSGCGSKPEAVTNQVDMPPVLAEAEQSEATDTASIEPEEKSVRISDDDFRFAAYEGNLEAVRQAIAAGNNVNAADPEKSLTALHMAAYNGHREVVQLLLENEATIDCRDNEGKTPLIHACTGPFAPTVEVLCAAGADVNARESTEAFTPLMMGAGLGEIEVVRVLLRHKADKSLRDDDGDSAIQHAKNSGHADIVELLDK